MLCIWLAQLLFDPSGFSSAGSVRTSFELLDSGWIVKMAELSLLCKYYAWVQQSNRVVCPTCHVRVKFICVCVCPASSLVTHSVSLLTHWCICVFAAFLVIFNAPKRPFDIPAVWGLVWYKCFLSCRRSHHWPFIKLWGFENVNSQHGFN